MSLTSGARLGRYEIVEIIGAGGLGEVYRAIDPRLGRMVAIKVLHAQFAVGSDARARFDREAQAIASLNHPNICAVFDVGCESHIDYLVMELLQGETLRQRLARGPLDLAAQIDIAIALADALDAAHSQGLIHRDLKPANILLTTQGQPKILDFGLAKPIRTGDDTTHQAQGFVTEAGAVPGTVAYMSPEQLRGEALDARTDLFSMGLILYEMATGRHAFPGTSTATISAAILLQAPAPPRAVKSGLPERLEQTILKTLEKDRSLRCQTAAELRADLVRLKRQLDPESVRATAVAPPARQRRWLMPSLAVAALLLLATISIVWRTWSNHPAPLVGAPTHRQVTFAGNASTGAISPDGRSVAFTAGFRLMVQDLLGGTALEIAQGVELLNPVWSPAGDQIAYSAGRNNERQLLFTVPRLGGPSRLVAQNASFIAWSPDGTRLAKGTQSSQGFVVVSLDGASASTVSLKPFRWLEALDWHAGSNRIGVLEKDDQGRSVVWVVNPDGKDARRVFTDSALLTALHWSPVADVIYAQRQTTEATDLIAIDVPKTGAGSARVVLSGLPPGRSLSVTGDGRSLLYMRVDTSNNIIAVDLTQPDRTPRQVTRGSRIYRAPRVSPDGKWIAAAVDAGASSHIVKIPFAGGDPLVLTTGDARDKSPDWSPDGSRIAFGSDRGGAPGVWVMTADGQDLTRLPVGPVGTNRLVVWTPSGAIGWQQRMGDNFLNYRIRDLTTGEEHLLAPSVTFGYLFDPRFSPSGNQVAVYWNQTDRGTYLLSPPDWTPRLIKKLSMPLGWSADGRTLYARSSFGGSYLHLVSVHDGVERTLDVGSSIVSGDASRDGRSLVLEVSDWKSDAWVVENFDPRTRR